MMIRVPASTDGASATIELSESLALLQALTAEVARRHDMRLLLIKGDSLTHHGLRRPRVHADVDVLLAPRDADRFIDALAKWGWRPRQGRFVGYPAPHHSVTLIHDNWNADIDVHREFPGFLRDPDEVFDALWARRTPMRSAHQTATITDFAGSVLVFALHIVRSGSSDPRFAVELHALVEASENWSESQRTDIAALAAATGCSHALEAILPRIDVELRDDEADPAALHRWRARIEGRATSFGSWWRAITGASPREWPRRLWHGIWPSEEYLRTGTYLQPDDQRVNRARALRLRDGMRRNARALLARLRPRSRS